MVQLSIQRDTAISIQQQLITQLSLQIASGQLPAGTRLPSIRALSKKLGIHYNTCLTVYKELEAIGMVESKRGSGVVVTSFESHTSLALSTDGLELHQLATRFLQAALQKGLLWSDIESTLKLIYRQTLQSRQTVVFADLHADILPVFQAELTRGLGYPVHTLDLSREHQIVAKENAVFMASRYHYRTLRNRLGAEATILLIDVGQLAQETEQIRTLKPGALVTVVSQSQVILSMAESMITGLRGHDLLLRPVLLEEGIAEIQQAVNHADLIFCDLLAANHVEALKLNKPWHIIHMISADEMSRICREIQHPAARISTSD